MIALHHYLFGRSHVVEFLARLDRLRLVGVEHELPIRMARKQRCGTGSDVSLDKDFAVP